jgi:putative transposase
MQSCGRHLRMRTMPRGKLRPTPEEVKALLAEDRDFLRPVVEAVLQELLEAEMTEALGAEEGERTPLRWPSRAGGRTLVTRVGKLELRVPQDRAGRFPTELFERYQRSGEGAYGGPGGDARPARVDAEEPALGLDPRVKAITEELCGHSLAASAISAINVRLDEGLAQFAGRQLDEACPI